MGNEQSRGSERASDEVAVVEIGNDLPEEVVEEGPPASAAPAVEESGTDPQLAPAASEAQVPATATAGGPSAKVMRELTDYKLEKVILGEGAFGKVRLATSSSTGHKVAVKVIKRKKLNERAELLLRREVRHHERLRHKNIVRLHTFIMTPNKYYLVMEYCRGGDLLHYINESPLLSDELARTLFRGLMEGIKFCHGIGIHHRDV